jgi:hypothetical protein
MLLDASVHRRSEDLFCGLGPCKYCSCRRFRGNGNICEECGHHYDEHTTGRSPTHDDPTTALGAISSDR